MSVVLGIYLINKSTHPGSLIGTHQKRGCRSLTLTVKIQRDVQDPVIKLTLFKNLRVRPVPHDSLYPGFTLTLHPVR